MIANDVIILALIHLNKYEAMLYQTSVNLAKSDPERSTKLDDAFQKVSNICYELRDMLEEKTFPYPKRLEEHANDIPEL